jgi:CheY-like chemotaxis protein
VTFPSKQGQILLVDDDPDLRGVLACALRSQGFEVEEAADGPSALTALAKCMPDMAIVDFAMPGMNGAELARHISERSPSVEILFASGYADTEAIEAVVGPERRMLIKPFRIDELLRAVDAILA